MGKQIRRDSAIIEDVEYDIVSFTLPNRYPRCGEELDEGIIGLIKNNPKITITEMARKLGVSAPAIASHLKTLKEDGKVIRIGGTRGRWDVCRPASGNDVPGDSVSGYGALGSAIEESVRKACKGKEVGIAFSGGTDSTPS